MRPAVLASLGAAACAALLVTVCTVVSGTGGTSGEQNPPPAQVYNPYPPGILPADLESEIERVRREVRGIETDALAQFRALPPLTLSNTQWLGNPATLQSTGYQTVQALGK